MLLVIILSALSLFTCASSNCLDKQIKDNSGSNTNEAEAFKFLIENNKLSEKMNNKLALASWDYESNITDYNENKYLQATNELEKFVAETFKNASSFAWKRFEYKNETAYKMFDSLAFLGTSALSEDKSTELTNIIDDMQNVYSKAKVCSYNSPPGKPCTLSIEPELTELLQESRNPSELQHVWTQWRDKTGKKIKKEYLRYVNLSNEAACLNGYSDNGELWRDEYESDDIIDEFEILLEAIKPLYQQLHAYVRKKLMQKYTSVPIKKDGPIPAHLLGNMWAETWSNIYDIVAPYPEKGTVDVTETMRKKKLRPLDMFKIAEEFFTSLGLIKMPPTFWNRSIFEKPTDRDLVCHASAWEFYDKKDFRIKMCTRVNMEDLITIHHEMGHIEYFLQYKDQPVVFRDGANAGFHEAIGDVMALSVATPGHLAKIGLLDHVSHDPETEINTLMNVALDKVAFVPYAYLIDAWRWKVFDGSIKHNELNTKWWKLRHQYQGLCPPVLRTECDFDAASKYHVAADVPYVRYFVSYVIQFQFHKALCEEAGYEGPLHRCDIYQSKEAGKLLSDMLKLGSSVSWREAMKIITKGKTDKMDAGPFLEYFKPLHDWLKKQNKNEYIGWKSNCAVKCPS